MSKFLNKSLIATMSSLCALSTSIDASFKADKTTTLEEAFDNSEDMGRKLKGQVRDMKKGENYFVSRENPGSFIKYKDIVQNVLEGLLEVGGSAAIGALIGKGINRGSGDILGALIGAIAGGGLFIPTKIRAIKNILRNEGFLKALYRISSLYDASVDAKAIENEEEAKSKGKLSIG